MANFDDKKLADNAKAQAYETIDSAERTAKDMVETAEWKAKAGVDSLSGMVGRVSDKVVYLKDKILDYGHEFKSVSSARKEQVETNIKMHPFTSTAIAFGIGVIAASLLVRRTYKADVYYTPDNRDYER